MNFLQTETKYTVGGKTVNIKREAAITPDLQGLDRHVIFMSRDLNVEMLCYNLYFPG